MDNLKGCPCCGYEARFNSAHYRDVSETWIECYRSSCHIRTKKVAWLGDDAKEREALADAWNTRPSLPEDCGACNGSCTKGCRLAQDSPATTPDAKGNEA